MQDRVKVTAVLVVLCGSLFLYLHLRDSGKSAALPGYHTSHYQPSGPNPYLPDSRKMSAAALEKLLDEDTLRWAPDHQEHMQCKRDLQGRWDFICRDAYLRATWGFDVDSVHVTSFLMLTHHAR
jgi:hypothetical protein